MRADLIERLRTGVVFDNTLVGHGYRIGDADELMAEAADALASQEPVGYVTPDVLAELAAGNIGGYIFPKGTLRPENEVALFASPVEPVVAAKAEAEGWMPIETAPKDSKARLVWVPENQCIYCVSWQSADGPSHPAGWSIFGGGWRSMVQGATHWMPLPAAPTRKGEGQP